MKKIGLMLFTFIWATNAQATLIFSDVSYTSNSVSFRTTGDLSGYSVPARPDYFSLNFEGDLFLSGVNPNISWSNAIFAGSSVANNGYSGDWATWNEAGAWLKFSSPLNSSSVALGEITTLTLGADVLNESATSGDIVFNWDIDSSFTRHTELGRVQVPEPGALILLTLGLIGIGFSRNKRMV